MDANSTARTIQGGIDMKRMIYAEDVIKNIDEWLDAVGTAYVRKGVSYYGELLGCIEDAPTVEPPKGEWEVKHGSIFDYYECNKCHACHQFRSHFCPHCGADMRKKE